MGRGDPPAQEARLAATFVRQGRVELALDPVDAVPGRLAVADEDQAVRQRGRRRGGGLATLGLGNERRTTGDAGLRCILARCSDLDIYTSFLSVPLLSAPAF